MIGQSLLLELLPYFDLEVGTHQPGLVESFGLKLESKKSRSNEEGLPSSRLLAPSTCSLVIDGGERQAPSATRAPSSLLGEISFPQEERGLG